MQGSGTDVFLVKYALDGDNMGTEDGSFGSLQSVEFFKWVNVIISANGKKLFSRKTDK